jgi:hypothetical protein
MAIRYTKAYNKEIRQAVKHFNTVRNTLSKRGIKLTPAPLKVSELKSRYQTRRELNKELTLLNKVSSSDDRLLKEVETSGGATAIKWQFDYLKQNAKNAIEYFEWEKKLELQKNPVYPHEKERLNEIEANLNILQMDVNYMNQNQFKEYSGAVREFFQIQTHMKNGYRGFLWQVENAMRISGYEEEDINKVFDKLKTLNPSEFREWYQTNSLVNRIYELVNSPVNGNEMKLTTSSEDAKILLDTLIEELDEDISKLKSK